MRNLILSLSLLAAFPVTAEVIPLSAQKAATTLKADQKIIIIDVRTPKEFAKGHIAKALNIDFKSPDFAKKLAKLDTSKTYLIHCRSGARSTRSLATWEKLGFKNILHLDTGYLGWLKAKQQVSQ